MLYRTLIFAALLIPGAWAIDHPAAQDSKQGAAKQQQQNKNAEAEARLSKKESRMSQRDKEMDRRMKQQKSFKK